MQDKLKPLPCPFCSSGETIIHENKGVWQGTKGYGEPISVEIQHWCEKEEGQPSPRRLVFVGRDEESAIRIWNQRATDKTIEALVEACNEAIKLLQAEISTLLIKEPVRYSNLVEARDTIRAALASVEGGVVWRGAPK